MTIKFQVFHKMHHVRKFLRVGGCKAGGSTGSHDSSMELKASRFRGGAVAPAVILVELSCP